MKWIPAICAVYVSLPCNCLVRIFNNGLTDDRNCERLTDRKIVLSPIKTQFNLFLKDHPQLLEFQIHKRYLRGRVCYVWQTCPGDKTLPTLPILYSVRWLQSHLKTSTVTNTLTVKKVKTISQERNSTVTQEAPRWIQAHTNINDYPIDDTQISRQTVFKMATCFAYSQRLAKKETHCEERQKCLPASQPACQLANNCQYNHTERWMIAQ